MNDGLCLECYISVLLLSYFIYSGALGSPGLLLSILYNNTSIAQHHHTNNHPSISSSNPNQLIQVTLVATALGVSADRVVLLQNEVEARRRRRLELSNSPSNTDTALSSENIMQWASDLAWSTVDSIGKSITRALATGDISLSVQIMGYSSSSAATTAVGTLSTYVGSSVSSGFTSQLNSNAGKFRGI